MALGNLSDQLPQKLSGAGASSNLAATCGQIWLTQQLGTRAACPTTPTWSGRCSITLSGWSSIVSAIASDHMVKCPGKFHSRFSCHGAHYGISPADNAVRTPDPVMPTLSSELIRARESCSFHRAGETSTTLPVPISPRIRERPLQGFSGRSP